MERGDAIFVDSGVLYNGYWGEFCRMAVMGPPSEENVRYHDLIRGFVRDFIAEILRPGITCEQAMQQAVGLYERAGIEPEQYTQYVNPPYFHLCHGLGLSASEPPLVRITDDTMLERGMTFSVEAYLKGPDILYGSEEDVLITESGCELLSEPDQGLYVIE